MAGSFMRPCGDICLRTRWIQWVKQWRAIRIAGWRSGRNRIRGFHSMRLIKRALCCVVIGGLLGGVCDKRASAQEEKGRRPGGANATFVTKEFRGTNDRMIRYSLFVPRGH